MAASKKTVYFCNECGYESAKWLGQCPACKQWNTFVEENVSTKKSSASTPGISGAGSVSLSEISDSEENRCKTGMEELDRVLGGGIVKGSLILVGGDPGIGKSTLLLQVCRKLSLSGQNILYVSGEESAAQIKMRALRIGDFNNNLKIYPETSLANIESVIRRDKPDAVVIDSIQTMYNEDVTSAPGSVSQVRESTQVLMQLAKGLGISIFIVGHVTKEGMVAGPRVLEHMVDTVLYFEGDRSEEYRILRGVKNRFGSTNEIGIFRMEGEGLVEVKNPSEYMIAARPEEASGSIISCVLEGTRPLLIEIQGLLCPTSFGIPRRQATGTDYNRVNLLLAVLERRTGLKLGNMDAYVNIAGGMKVNDPSIDLAIISALVSSIKDKPVDQKTVCFGEVGLSGEVRGVSRPLMRVKEAERLGFQKVIVPKAQIVECSKAKGIEVVGVSTVKEAINYLT